MFRTFLRRNFEYVFTGGPKDLMAAFSSYFSVPDFHTMWAGTFGSNAQAQSRLRGLTCPRLFVPEWLAGFLPAFPGQWQWLSQDLGFRLSLCSYRLPADTHANSGLLRTEDASPHPLFPWLSRVGHSSSVATLFQLSGAALGFFVCLIVVPKKFSF